MASYHVDGQSRCERGSNCSDIAGKKFEQSEDKDKRKSEDFNDLEV